MKYIAEIANTEQPTIITAAATENSRQTENCFSWRKKKQQKRKKQTHKITYCNWPFEHCVHYFQCFWDSTAAKLKKWERKKITQI